MLHFRVFLTLVGSFLLLGAMPSETPSPVPERVPLLSNDVIPLSYDLSIAPEKWNWGTGGTATGEETIVLDVRKATSEIVLNAATIKIAAAEIDGVAASAKNFPVAQQTAFTAGAAILPGQHTLHIRFTGRILADAAGLWPDNLSSPSHPNLVSLFEPARARSLFPCFDEPQFRATFTIRVRAPSSYAVISNMPLASKTPISGSSTSVFAFAPTPPIAPYLLTLDMGDFAVVSGTAGKTPVNVYIRPGKEAIAKAALAETQRIIPFYENLFGVAFPAPKLDVIIASGVLNDVSDGFGAITLFTEFEISGQQMGGGIRGQQTAFNTLAQPIAQQWFGGMVGVRSWGDAWVTAGLASWAEARAERALHPEIAAALPRDLDWPWNAVSLWGSLAPLRNTVKDDRDQASFDTLMAAGNDSGEAALSQWNSFIGDTAMRAAVRNYLTKKAGSAAIPADFWSAFGTKEAQAYGDAWLNQPGAPAVLETTTCRKGSEYVSFVQRGLQNDQFHDRVHSRWPIPLSVSANGQTRWIALAAAPASIFAGKCGSPMVADLGLRPPYPLRYDVAALRALAGNASLSAIDRKRILRDTTALDHAGLATLPEFLAAIRLDTAATSGDATVVFNGDRDVAGELQALRGSRYEARFGGVLQATFLPLMRKVGFTPDVTTASFMAKAYDAMGYFPDPGFAQLVRDAWRARRDKGDFFGSQAWSVMRYAAAAAEPADVDWALQRIANHPGWVSMDDPINFLQGLRDRAAITRVLDNLQSRRIGYPYMVWEIGTREPAIISDYLDTHLHQILASVPPTQQAGMLASGVAYGPWAARTPKQWRAFLQKTVNKRDAAIVDAAMKQIVAKWKLRTRLERELADAR